MRIEVGKIIFSIEAEGGGLKALHPFYEPFLTSRPPIYKIKVKFSGNKNDPDTKTGATYTFVNQVYRLESEEFRVRINLKERQSVVELFSAWPLEALNSAINNICTFIIFQRRGLVLHASAIARNGKAYIFLGPSGSGKTTVAQASRNDPILSQETVGILNSHREPLAFSIPYQQDTDFPLRGEKYYKIAGLFRLIKDKRNYLEPVKKSRALAEFLVLPAGVQEIFSLADCFGQYGNLVEKVPCYNLHFLPDKSFWRCIDGVLN